MLTAKINNDPKSDRAGELITTGQIEVGDIYPGLCCAGYNWEVVLIFPNDTPAYHSIWGTCQNPACTGKDGVGTEHYQGVSNWLQEDFEERLAKLAPLAQERIE